MINDGITAHEWGARRKKKKPSVWGVTVSQQEGKDLTTKKKRGIGWKSKVVIYIR